MKKKILFVNEESHTLLKMLAVKQKKTMQSTLEKLIKEKANV